MDRARKSLSSLRQAASMRPAPPTPSMSLASAASPTPSSPYSGNFLQESANPMYNNDLARAAAPSTASIDSSLRRAASPSNVSSLDMDLRRAAAPSTGSSVNPMQQHRVADSSTSSYAPAPPAYNPIVSREMAGASKNQAMSPASTSFGSYDVEDPSMNKQNLTPTSGSTMNLLKAQARFILVPARFIKEKTWGTPRRRACTSVCLLIFFIIFIYLVVRLVDTLRILDSSPALAEFKIAELCTSTFDMGISGSLMNPSGSAATVLAMKSEVWIGNASEPDGMGLVGYVITPDVYIGSGNTSLNVQFEVEIPLSQGPHVRKVLQDFFAGAELDALAKIPLTASFAADVFIVPISYSTTLEIALKLPKFNLTGNGTEEEYEEELPDDYEEEEEQSLIKEVDLMQPRNPLSYLAAKVGLKLFSKKDFRKSFLEVTAPPIMLEVHMGGHKALTAQTSLFHYGKNLLDELHPNDFGSINVTASAGDPDVNGFHYGIHSFMDKSKLPLKVKIVNSTHPEIDRYRTETNRECHLQSILNGLEIEQELDLESLLSPPEETNPTKAPTPSLTPAEPLFEFLLYQLMDVQSQGIMKNRIGVDLAGLANTFGVHGTVPSVQVLVETDSASASDPTHPTLVRVNLAQTFSFSAASPIVNQLDFDLQLMSATHLIRAADSYFLNNNDVTVYVRTDPTGSILSRLLSAATIDLSIMDLMGGGDEDEEDSRRRRRLVGFPNDRRKLQEEGGDSIWAGKAIKAIVSSYETNFNINVSATGFDTEFFGGARLKWERFQLAIELRDMYFPTLWTTPVLYLDLTAYDTDNVGGTVSFALWMLDDYDGTGEILVKLVDDIVTFQPIEMLGLINYNKPQFAKDVTKWIGDDFIFQRTEDVTVNASSNASPSFSFFNLYHGELVNLTQNNFYANLYFALNLGEVEVEVEMPDIDIAIGRCGQPYFIAISMDSWSFKTGEVAAFAPLQVEFEDASRVLETLSLYAEGKSQVICIGGHPTRAHNYLSNFVRALSLDIVIPGRSEEATPVGNEADLLDLALTSTDRDACIKLQMNLTDPNNVDNTSTSFGWGEVALKLNLTHNAITGDVLEIKVDEGWYGHVDEYRIANFYGPETISPVTVEVCILADETLALHDAQELSKSGLQRLYDEIAFDVGVGGTIKRRIPPVGQVSHISGNFRAPATTFKSLSSLGGTTAAANVNATEWFELLEMELISFDGDTFSTKITFETGSVGFNLSLPEVSFRVGKLTTPGDRGTEIPLFDVSTFLPPFGFREKYPLPISLGVRRIPPQDWGDTLQLIDDLLKGVADVSVGSTTDPDATLLSQVIPTISFSLSKKDVVSPPTPGPDNLDVVIRAVSTATSASVLADFKVLQRLDYKFIWGTINCRLFNGDPADPGSTEIGRIFVPGQILQEVNSGPLGINVTLYGDAYLFATDLFDGELSEIGFQGTIGESTFTSYFKIPTSITESLALGSDDSSSEATSSLDIIDAAILGASAMGQDGTLPCVIDGMCDNLIKGDTQFTPSGITAGVTLRYDLPKINRVKWKVSLESDVYVSVSANGFNIGKVVIRPISAQSNQNEFSPVFSVLPLAGSVPELRATIGAVLEGYDTVFTLGGDPTENYISKLLSAIEQDVSILDIPPPDPDAPSMLGDLDLKVISTVRNQAVLDATMPFLWDSDSLTISVGSLEVHVIFGHTTTCGGFCDDGIHIATAQTKAPLKIVPSPSFQPLSLRASIFHSGGVLSRSHQAIDTLISKFIWKFEMNLEADILITPLANNRYGATQPFKLKMYLTLPQSAAVSQFIDDIQVDVWGTISSSLGDVKVKANKVLYNEMNFPLVVSYYQYQIKLVDRDGVAADGGVGGCIVHSGVMPGVNPCSFFFCYDPWNTPSAIGPMAKSGDYSQLKPGTSILKNGQKRLEPGGRGDTELMLDVTVETAARLVDEMMTKGTMCGDIADGIIVVALQADPNCDDAGRLEKDLRCTYPLRIIFSIRNYPLSDLDTCGSFMEVPDYIGTTFYQDGLEQFTAPYSMLNPGGSNVVRLITNANDKGTRSSQKPINTEDSFEIQFDLRVESNCMYSGVAVSLTFLRNMPSQLDQPRIVCDSNCDDTFASNNLGQSAGYASLVLNFKSCNALAWVHNGQTSPPYRGSQACGDQLDSGNWGTVIFTYNAHDHRATASYKPGGGITRAIDFDLNLKEQLDDSQYAYMAMVANGGEDGWLGSTCSIAEYRNFVHRGPRTDGSKTTIEGGFSLVRVGEEGLVRFRARDANGRKRGRGGNGWVAEIRQGSTVIPNQVPLGNQIVDHLDGSYSVKYKLNTRGRFSVHVACQAGTAPNNCNNAGNFQTITTNLFVRE